jgi:hypothetical protein
MDVLPLASLLDVVFPQLRIFLDIADAFARKFVRGYQLWKWYGQAGVPLFIFGNRTTWRIQAQILGELNDDDALAFKTSVYNECTMIAVAVSIPVKGSFIFVLTKAGCHRSSNCYHGIIIELFKPDPLGCKSLFCPEFDICPHGSLLFNHAATHSRPITQSQRCTSMD